MRPDETHLSPAGIKGGQGRSAEDVEVSTIACAICLLGMAALIGLAWLLNALGVMCSSV